MKHLNKGLQIGLNPEGWYKNNSFKTFFIFKNFFKVKKQNSKTGLPASSGGHCSSFGGHCDGSVSRAKRRDDGHNGGCGEVRQPGERTRSARHQSVSGRGAAVFQPGVFTRAVSEGEGGAL